MRRTTAAVIAALVLGGAASLDAQERNVRSWWQPAVLSLLEDGDIPILGYDGPWDDDEAWDDEWADRAEMDEEAREREREYREEMREAARERMEEEAEARREYEKDRREAMRERAKDRREAMREREQDRREYEREMREAREEYEQERREAMRERGQAHRGERRGNGPPFCRNGQGHPVHGMAWCHEKGWVGDPYGARGPLESGWARAGWTDVLIEPAREPEGRLTQPSLVDILGSVILGRIADHGYRSGMDGELDGRWLETPAGSVIQLRMGGMPLAELLDADRDGLADAVLLNGR